MRKKFTTLLSISIMFLMLTACGANKDVIPSSSEAQSEKEETTVTEQAENSTNTNKESNGSEPSDNLPSEGFDHIKVPTIDAFYEEGLSNNNAFALGNRPEWESAWNDAYEEFLAARGSATEDIAIWDNIIPNYNQTQDYQYIYYGSAQEPTDGLGDIVLGPSGMYPPVIAPSEYKDTYFLGLFGFTYGEMDKELEKEYRAAMTLLARLVMQVELELGRKLAKLMFAQHTTVLKANSIFLQSRDINCRSNERS